MKRILIGLLTLMTMVSCREDRLYDAEGNFESDEVIVSAEATGKIVSFAVREGMQVDRGQAVGAIDSLQLHFQKLQLLSSAVSVERSRPDVEKQIRALEEQLRNARAERRRIGNLLKDGAATSKQMDDITSTIAVLEGQLSAQKSTLDRSVASLNAQKSAIDVQVDQVGDLIDKCVVTSPIRGTVLVKYAQEGEFAATGKPLFKVADLDRVYLRAYLTSGQLSGVKLGQPVKVFADFGGEQVRTYDGVVEWISSKSEFTPKNIQSADERENLVYAVKVAVQNDGYIKLGMYGGLRLQ